MPVSGFRKCRGAGRKSLLRDIQNTFSYFGIGMLK